MGWTAEDEARSRRQADQIIAARGSSARRRVFFGVLATVAVVSIFVSVGLVRGALQQERAAVSPPVTAHQLPALAAADRSIKRVDIDGREMTVFADLPASDRLQSAIDVVASIGEALSKPHADQDSRVDEVMFIFNARFHDRLGVETSLPAGVVLTFRRADLAAAHYDVLTPGEVLALATHATWPKS
jgi:hypothetical protein